MDPGVARLASYVGRLSDSQLQQETRSAFNAATPALANMEIQNRNRLRASVPPQIPNLGGVPMDMGFPTPQAFQADYDQRYVMFLRQNNLPDSPMTREAYRKQAEGEIQDFATPVMAEQVAAQQAQLDQAKRSSRGRSLMDTGVAMLQSNGNFWNALGQGGQAGLASMDRTRANEQGIMQALMQAKMAQAQSQAAHQGQILDYVNTERGIDSQGRSSGQAYAMGIAGQNANMQGNIAEANQRVALQDDAQANQIELARMSEAGADRRQAMQIAASRTGGGAGGAADRYGLNSKEDYLKMLVDQNPEPGRTGHQTLASLDIEARRLYQSQFKEPVASPRVTPEEMRAMVEQGRTASAAAPAQPGARAAVSSGIATRPTNGGRGAGGQRNNPARVQSQDQFDRLPTGAWFVNPADGRVMQKDR